MRGKWICDGLAQINNMFKSNNAKRIILVIWIVFLLKIGIKVNRSKVYKESIFTILLVLHFIQNSQSVHQLHVFDLM